MENINIKKEKLRWIYNENNLERFYYRKINNN